MRARQLHALLPLWPALEPADALILLSGRFADTLVRSHAVQWIDDGCSDDVLCDFLPQLVQAVKHEPYEDSAVVRLLLRRAMASSRICHCLFWLFRSDIGVPRYRCRMANLLMGLIASCGGAQREQVGAIGRPSRRIPRTWGFH